ncbi:cyclic-di-AMP receptor [Deinococcus pimensis]|uniref:cyclic-di-AMP receptor n=1 Tax=Deinococcus pimensis TaxID=309888 RepID=UPI000480F043|nr:cyclic-di-AMP receptor [Deinococcus pimensis]
MRLVLAVVQDADVASLLRALNERHLSATKLASTGGFLREGNTTLLIGVEEDRVPEVLGALRLTCRRRTRLVDPRFASLEEGMTAEAVEVEVGGAVVFVLRVETFLQL